MAFRSTEISVRDVLLEEIRARGIRIGHELSAPLPTGRMAPDAILSNGAEYVLETKLGGEADLFEDIKKLTEWIKLGMIPIKGAFAVLLPGEFRNLPWQTIKEVANSPNVRFQVAALFRDERPGDRRIGSLSEIADWIANHILHPPKEVEIDTEFVIKVLAGAVGQLTYQMKELDVKQLEDIFGGRSVFDNILEISPGNVPIENLHSAASYLLINQLIFYQVLSHAEPTHYQTINVNDLFTPSDLSRYFQKVLEVDYAPTFGFDIASRLPKKSTDLLKSVIEVIQAMGVARLRQDVLGKVFHNLIPLSIRKSVAAYYTNGRAAELLASLSVEDCDDTILDPACGSGTLLVASYQRKRQLLMEKMHGFTVDDHKRFLGEEITGIDIMPFAAHLAVVHLSLQAPHFITQKARVAVEDSTKLKPGDRIPSITRELNQAFRYPTLEMFESDVHPKKRGKKFIEKGVLTANGFGGEELQLDSVDVVIMNPPFTSSDHLKPEYKVVLKKRFGKKYDGFIRGKISFQGHFLLLSDKFLRKGGRIAAVLPQTTLTGETFAPIVRMLTSEYAVCAIIVGLGRSAFSENTALSEILLVAEKRKPDVKQRFPLIGTKTDPSEWTQEEIRTLIMQINSAHDSDDYFATIKWVKQEDLLIERGGFASLLPRLNRGYKELISEFRGVLESPLMIPYKEIESKLRIKALISPLGNKEADGAEGRGGVFFGTSALNILRSEERALKKVDRLVAIGETSTTIRARDRVTGMEVSIPRTAVVPSVRRISHYSKFDVTNLTDAITSKAYSGLSDIMRGIYGEDKGRVFTARVREKWPQRIQQGMSRLFLERRVDIAGPGTHHIAVFTKYPAFTGRGPWGIRDIKEDDAKLLCLWFNSSLFLLQMLEHRTQTRGTWWELSKHHFEKTYAPDISKLNAHQRKQILLTFEHLSDLEFPSLLEQLEKSFDGRREIDKIWLNILGAPEEEQDNLINKLHLHLSFALTSLLSAMEKD